MSAGRWCGSTGRGSRNHCRLFPLAGGKAPISTDGGGEPVWARNGRELYYREGDKILAVAVESGSTLKASAPRVLFEGQYARVVLGEANYDVSPDGRRFLMIRSKTQPPLTELLLVVNWSAELRESAGR